MSKRYMPMTGTIKSYSAQLGEGVITSAEDINYGFDSDAWSTASWLPESGLIVKFDIDGNRVKNISVDYTHEEKIKKDKHKKDTPQLLKVPRYTSTFAIDNCIREYFKPYDALISKYKNIVLNKNELDYLKIKRFLFTAYNNLTDIHFDFKNDEIIRFKNMIDEAERYFVSFKKQSSHVKSAYAQIFLQKQDIYKELENKKKYNLEKIKNYQLLIQQNSSEKDSNKKEVVDAIHMSRVLADENAEIIEEIELFQRLNYEAFKDAYRITAKKCESYLIKILNSLAYYLDKSIWESANQSEVIKEYFEKANISEKFSSSVYLKYYINSLDMSKMSEESRELRKILLYFQSKEQQSTDSKDEQLSYDLSHSVKALLRVKNKISLFKSLNQREIINVIEKSSFLKLGKDEILLNEDDIGEEVYFIIDGEFSVQVFDSKKEQNIEVATLGKNSIVGEIAPIIHQRRSATIQAKTAATVISFTINHLAKAKYPKTYIKLYENFMDLMAKKLIQNNQKIQNMSVVDLEKL